MSVSARDWQVVPEHSTLQFTARYQDEPFRGEFRNFKAEIRYDPQDLAHARFDVRIKLTSVDTQSRERDQTLTGSDFFDTDKYPAAHFVTTGFERTDSGQVLAHGTLQLHGVKKPVTLQVDYKPEDGGATLDVRTTLHRHDFKLGLSDDWADIGNEVPVHGHLQLQ